MRHPAPSFVALAVVLGLGLGLGLGATSAAAQAPSPEPTAAPAADAERAAAPIAAPADSAEAQLPPATMTERRMRAPERLTHRPSGFWTSNRPARGGAYQYGKLTVGVVLVILTGILMLLAIRRFGGPAARPTTWPTLQSPVTRRAPPRSPPGT